MTRGYGFKLCLLASAVIPAARMGLAANALAVPATGVYLGIWANPNLGSNQEQAIEILEGPGPDGIHHTFALHLVYYGWGDIAGMLDPNGIFQPDAELAGDMSHGRVPVISWHCDGSVPNSNHAIAGGNANEDANITATANALKQYPGPVLLRWFWEFNVLSNNQSCRGDTGGTPTPQVYNDFTGAWQHIWTLFQKAGANNVVFLWNPGYYGDNPNKDPHQFYPGNGYVDWIGIDTYQRAPAGTFVSDFGQFYSDFTASQFGNKPLMAGENGAQGFSINNTESQAAYLQGLQAGIKGGQYPLLKAYDYFDSPGNAPNNWVLDSEGGMAEFAAIAASGAFVPGPVNTPIVPLISKVGNAEGENPVIAANTWVEVKGSNLAPAGDTRIWQSSDFVTGQMPTNLDGVSVTVNGQAAYVYYISPTQINILTPPNLASGPVQLAVTNNNIASAAFTGQAQPISPSFFVFSDGQHVAAVHANGTLLGPSSLSVPGYTFTPAQPGETVQIYANGFGTTSSAVATGSSSQSGTLSPTPSVTIGGVPATVTFAGLISPGLFQFNVVVPLNAPGGDEPMVATYNGQTTQTGTLVTLTGTAPPTSVTYYVAPNGNDSWSGTLTAPNAAGTDGPLATFAHARAAVQSLKKSGLTQVAVQFRAGTYYSGETIQFTAADSGTANLNIVYENYPGETPVFSGGVRITNWTNVSGNTWKATLPASTQYFENLFYNRARRPRPRLGGVLGTYLRFPGPVYLSAPGPPAAAPDPNCPAYVTGSGWECFDRFQYAAGDPVASTWKNLAPPPGNACNEPAGNAALAGDIELIDFERYTVAKMRVSCVNTATRTVYLTGSTLYNPTAASALGFLAQHRYLIENVEDELTQPGQWFLDRSTNPWTLTYLANPGENPNTDLVVMPQLAQVLVASGLQYVTFQGLTFAHDNYTIPAAGAADEVNQIAAAVSFQNSQHITFDSSIVTQTSGAGLEFISCLAQASPVWCVSRSTSAASANNVIQNSAFYDVGHSGLRIGVPQIQSDTTANIPQFHTVQNNVVEGYGRVFAAAFGIFQGDGHDNLYTHNDVYDGYKGAIHVCDCSGSSAPSLVANNTISFNHVHDLFQGIMNDGGSLYFQGSNTGSPQVTGSGNKILDNKVHDVSDASVMDSDGYGGDGLYVDNFSGLIDLENNLVYRVSGNALSFSGPRAGPNDQSTVKNNIFAFARGSLINAYDPYTYNVQPPAPLFFVASNNLFYFDRAAASTPAFYTEGGCTYAGAAFTTFEQWNSNLYWGTDGGFASDPQAFHYQANAAPGGPCYFGQPSKLTFLGLTAWQTLGEDAQSLVQNPGFNNPAYPADDYSLPKGSPGAGFLPFDPTQAGRTNPVITPPSIAATFPTKTFNPATDY